MIRKIARKTKRILKRFVKWTIGMSEPNRTLCLYKTLWFNYIAFGFKGLQHLPVYIYHNTKIYSVGKITITCPMKRGMLQIGQLDYKSQGITKFCNAGEIIIRSQGGVEIGGCTILENSGMIDLHGFNRIPDGCYILIRDRFVMGEQSRLGFHSFVMDSDDHFTIDLEARKVCRNTKPIIIGRYNWIASNSYIKKGVKTPDFLIVASANALLTKDYSVLPPYSVIGGAPAKLLKTGIRRIYNVDNETMLNNYFKENPETGCYQFSELLEFEDICRQTDNRF